jgi:hypothetical protein
MTTKFLSVALMLMALLPNVTVAQSDLWRTMKKGALMASDETTLKMAIGMWVRSDFEAMGELHALGRLDITNGKEKVDIVKVHMFGGKTEVRKKGSSKIWWITTTLCKKPTQN